MILQPRRTRCLARVAFCFLTVVGTASFSQAAQLRGTVELGGARTKVTLFEATQGKPRAIDQTLTNHDGEFQLESPRDETQSIFFVTADIGWRMQLVTILGSQLPDETTINELTTVAASYSMAQFYRDGYISGPSTALQIAAGMSENIVTPMTGESSPVLLESPNADQTNSLRLTRSLSNLLDTTAENPYLRFLFLHLTRSSHGEYPSNTATAMANLARDPGKNVRLIYLLSRLQETYSPALVREPDAWTVTIKLNDSGDDDFLFGGPANVAFDSRGYAWITNNVVQGTPNSSKRLMVLQPNGKPADGGHGIPNSPVTGAGILGVAWGITVDRFDNVWVGNFGWGDMEFWPTEEPPGNGSVSVVASDGTAISGPKGIFAGTYRVQAIEADARGNIWMASFGNDRVVCFPQGNPDNAVYFDLEEGDKPFGLAFDPDGAVWVTNSGGLTGRNQSSVVKLVLKGHKIEQLVRKDVGHTLKVIDVDSQGNAWFSSQGENRIYAIKPDGTFLRLHDHCRNDGGLDGPWGLTIDGEDNIWVTNFGPTSRGVFRQGGISKFAGTNKKTRPPGVKVGEALSPPTGYTVPTAGSEVLLHDGTPLLGAQRPPSFVPFQRQTSLKIDQAGNLWTINNYKPRWVTDLIGYDNGELRPANANPGGDGIIIYVGLAPPRTKKSP